MEDYRKYEDLECYLFRSGEVQSKFEQQRCLNAFDFFCIVSWKSNRVKPYIAEKLKTIDKDLEKAVRKVTSEIYGQEEKRGKLRYLVEDCEFGLPMSSAILTVLYPNEFTVYDTRVCKVLSDEGYKNYSKLRYDRKNFDKTWQEYEEYKRDVGKACPKELNLTLRDKDRYLWGKSFADQLKDDIEKGVPKKDIKRVDKA